MKKYASTTRRRRQPGRNTIRKTVSLPEAVLERGLSAAAAARRTFSNYVSGLIEADKAEAGQSSAS